MKYSSIILIINTMICFTAFAKQRSNFGIEKNVIVSGIISNYNVNYDPATVTIGRWDFFDIYKTYTKDINFDGTFEFEIPLSYTQELFLKYEKEYPEYSRSIRLLCIPGDSLNIKIENDFLKDSVALPYLKFSNSKKGKTNWLINKFQHEIENKTNIYDVDSLEYAQTKMSNVDYKEYINRREKKHHNFLKVFINDNVTTEMFRKWANDNLSYETMFDLMIYSYLNRKNKDANKLSDRYFNFLDNYNMDDNDLFSSNHVKFIQYFSIYSLTHPIDSSQKARKLYKSKEYKKSFATKINMINLYPKGFTRDLIISYYYINGIIKGKDLKPFEEIYDSTLISEPYFITLINHKYQELKDYLSNQDYGNVNILSSNSKNATSFLDSIVQKNQNNVIFVDFWAPWCSPCMNEMPYSKLIQEYFKDDDVAFLFLANNCKKDLWKTTIVNKKLTGEHVLLTRDQYNVLSDAFDFTGIPHYVLIDKKGNVVLKDAPRPSDKENVINEIKRQLNK